MHGDSYFSYLLRLWRSEVQGRAVWHASLECTRTGERKLLSLQGLLTLLRERFGSPEPDEQRPNRTVVRRDTDSNPD